MQLYLYFVSESREFCCQNTLCCFSTSVYCFLLFISSSTQSGKFWIHPRILEDVEWSYFLRIDQMSHILCGSETEVWFSRKRLMIQTRGVGAFCADFEISHWILVSLCRLKFCLLGTTVDEGREITSAENEAKRRGTSDPCFISQSRFASLCLKLFSPPWLTVACHLFIYVVSKPSSLMADISTHGNLYTQLRRRGEENNTSAPQCRVLNLCMTKLWKVWKILGNCL